MRGHAPPVEEDLHGQLREARLDVFVHELIRDAIEIVIHLHVIIDVDDQEVAIERGRSAVAVL